MSIVRRAALLSILAIACGHDEPPAATPVVAPAETSAPTATAAPVATTPPVVDAGIASADPPDAPPGEGRGEGIGLGNIGTIGKGDAGAGHGRNGTATAPSIRQGTTSVNGRLPPEVIQRIVRQNFGKFRVCYENGLKKKADLQGKVSVKFVIDRAGAVSTAQDGGSDLPDKDAVSCVVKAFAGLKFPQPEGGIVTVVYPIMFSPGD